MDPIADMLTQIRNALAVRKTEVWLPHSNFKEHLAVIMQKQGWLERLEVIENQKRAKQLKLQLKYDVAGSPVISGLKAVSKSGQRIYAKVSEISGLKVGQGATIVSTSKGLMTDRQAKQEKLGGEIICQIW